MYAIENKDKKGEKIMMNIDILVATLTHGEKDALQELLNIVTKMLDKPSAWTPTTGEEYYFLWSSGRADHGTFGSSEKDSHRLEVGNYFKTRKEAEEMTEYLKVVTKLKAYATEHNDPINWDDHDERKYKLCYNRETGKVDTTWSRRKITDGIYFSSHEVAMAAVREVGEEKILNYYLPH